MRIKRTKEQLLLILDKKEANILLIGEYIDYKHKIKCKCKVCGFEQDIYPNKLVNRNQKCKRCTKERRRIKNTLSQEDWINNAKKVHGNKYNYSKVNYINAKTKVCIICPEHGEFWQTPTNHVSGKKGCPKCAKELSIPILLNYSLSRNILCKESFEEKANKVHNYEYEYLEEYKTAMKKVKIKHKLCGHEFYITPHNHIVNKEGCPFCCCSKGELLITKILKNNNIKYIYLYELPIDVTINISGKAYVDFYLPELNIIIEYNGIQHYVPIKHFGGNIRFKLLLKRDSFIRNYCKKNNIKLVELAYNLSEDEILEICKCELL